MKKLLFIFLVFTAAIISCKTAKKSAYMPPAENSQVVMAEEDKNKKGTDVSTTANEVPIMMKTEEVSIAQNEDQSKGGYSFYVIIGSFSKPENAGKFKIELINKDFSPVVLNSESGFLRVAVGQTNSETEARDLITNIRNIYPEFKDVWLLKKK
jgi:cell division protein FtsN